MSESELLTIAIPTFNRRDAAARGVEEFLALPETPDVKLMVIDNASPDGTYDELRSRFADPRVRVLRNDRNLGFAGNFLRVIEEAAGEYVLLLSDEDSLNAEGLARLSEFLKRRQPTMVCPIAQVGSNSIYRGRSATRPIEPSEFESASFYLSGLTFSTEAASRAAAVVKFLIPDNAIAVLYPQVLVTALLVAVPNGGYFLNAAVSAQRESLATHITEASGKTYTSVASRWEQFKAFEEFFRMDHSAVTGPQASERLDQMREAMRAGVITTLIAAATSEVPSLAPYADRHVPRSFGGYLSELAQKAFGRART